MQEYHLLHINDNNRTKTYHLSVATLSIGRDSSNGIRVKDPSVSRHHIILIRMPLNQFRYTYELVDGDLEGCRSQNGVFINGISFHRKILTTGDRIQIGSTSLEYIVASMTPQEYQTYFEAHNVDFRSLKQAVVSPVGTIANKFHPEN